MYQIILAAAVLLSAELASAEIPEWDQSLSLGVGISMPVRANLNQQDSAVPLNNVQANSISLQSSIMGAAKWSIWDTRSRSLTGLDFGIELEAMTFKPDIKAQRAGTVTVTSELPIRSYLAGLTLLARYPFAVTDELPFGRWYPYIGVGGGASISDMQVMGSSDRDVSPYIQGLAGAKVFLNRSFALFAEYKATRASHHFQFGTLTEDIVIKAHHVMAGVAWHF